jgi:hypothetical protein
MVFATYVSHVTYQTVGHIHSHDFKHGMDVSHGSMTDMNLFFLHIKLVLRPHSILHCFTSYLFLSMLSFGL